MKRIVIPFIIILIGVLIVSGCNSASSPSPTPTTTAPRATAPATTVPTTTAPTSTTAAASKSPITTSAATTAAATTPSKYGGVLKFIQASAPGTPIGWMPETAGASVITMQVVMEYPLQEDLNGKG
jgi:hypothetical protein